MTAILLKIIIFKKPQWNNSNII